MTGCRVESICLMANNELFGTLGAYNEHIGPRYEPHVTSYLLTYFLTTMCCIADAVRFDLLIDSTQCDQMRLRRTTTNVIKGRQKPPNVPLHKHEPNHKPALDLLQNY